jgi:hypothetical protein
VSSFNFSVKDLGNDNTLYIIDIEDIGDNLKACLDNWFVKVCEGNRAITLNIVKSRVASFLDTKKGSTTEMGAIAEFILHVFLNEQGYEPQFLYTNLEENSIKKGFDGYYFFAAEEWILESKSGSIATAGISHKKKVKESYDDLKSKLAGEGSNNPWENAYKHASQLDVGANSNVRKNIDTLSQQYTRGIFQQIEKSNIIPGATIFLNGIWSATDAATLEVEVSALIKELKFNKIVVLCVTKTSLQLFIDYLKI